MMRGIHHTALSTPDLDRMLVFYRDLLGFEVVSEFAWPAGAELPDRITGLGGSACPKRPVCDHGITHVCLDVVDVDAGHCGAVVLLHRHVQWYDTLQRTSSPW